MSYDMEMEDYREDMEFKKKHKEELKSTGINTDNHIYWNLLFLKEWLEKNDIREKND